MVETIQIAKGICCLLEDTRNMAEPDLSILTVEQLRRYGKFRKSEDARAFYSGRKMVRDYALRNYPDQKISWRENEFGKPVIEPGLFHFNISHSVPMVATVFSGNCQIGVDIEKAPEVPFRELLKMARVVFSAGEVGRLSEMNEKEARIFFTRLWTLKESYIKYHGKGFAIDTRTIKFDRLWSDRPVLRAEKPKELNFELRTLENGFFLAVAFGETNGYKRNTSY